MVWLDGSHCPEPPATFLGWRELFGPVPVQAQKLVSDFGGGCVYMSFLTLFVWVDCRRYPRIVIVHGIHLAIVDFGSSYIPD